MRPLTIGFLAARLDDPYQHAVWSGAVEEAKNLGVQIVFFGGQRLQSPIGFEALDNVAFDVAAKSHLVALVVMTNVIGTYLNAEELFQFLRHFKNVPIVSVGVKLPEIPSIRINNTGGMVAVANHLVQIHNRKRFLFLAGPPNHSESVMRETEFRQQIAQLLDNQAMLEVEYCNFQEEDAYQAMKQRLNTNFPFDAVVAANDVMAFGALRALTEKGIAVPQTISVTGFDDTDDSRFSIPPLTTVRQETCELGRQAIRFIVSKLGFRADIPPLVEAGVSFIIRESCGCPPTILSTDAGKSINVSEDSLIVLSQAVNEALSKGKNPAALKPENIDPLLRDRALFIIADGIARYQADLRRSAERRAAVIQEIESSLVASFSLPDILLQVAQGTRALGISACWLAIFESKGATPEWARLVLASEEGNSRILAPYGLRFRTSDLLPGGLSSRWNAYVCEPLRFGDERLGYFICTADSEDRRVFDAMRDQISSAIKGALLMAAERDREWQLEHEVRLRTTELSTANTRLKEEIKRRSTLERELLDISNEIMGRIGQDIHDDLCQDIAGIALMAAILEGNLRRIQDETVQQYATAASAIATVASKTATKAKSIARGLYLAELEAKGLVEAVTELVKSVQERSTAMIHLEVTPGFSIKDSDKALQLYRIIQEALNNAIAHAHAQQITVALKMDRESIQVVVTDDGTGIITKNSNGMGLRIIKYRASVVGGELKIQSGEGATTLSCRVMR